MLSAAGRRELALWPAATVTGLHRSADESQRIDACLTHLCGLSKPTWESFVVNESIVRLTVQQQAAHSLCSGSRSAGWLGQSQPSSSSEARQLSAASLALPEDGVSSSLMEFYCSFTTPGPSRNFKRGTNAQHRGTIETRNVCVLQPLTSFYRLVQQQKLMMSDVQCNRTSCQPRPLRCAIRLGQGQFYKSNQRALF